MPSLLGHFRAMRPGALLPPLTLCRRTPFSTVTTRDPLPLGSWPRASASCPLGFLLGSSSSPLSLLGLLVLRVLPSSSSPGASSSSSSSPEKMVSSPPLPPAPPRPTGSVPFVAAPGRFLEPAPPPCSAMTVPSACSLMQESSSERRPRFLLLFLPPL